MSYWDWAVEVHGRPGVDQALTALQDEHGQCVAYLLWAAWASSEDRALDAGTLARAAELAARWEASATGPLRQARRELKAPRPPVGDEARIALREQVRKAEFAAERLLMETLEAMAPPAGGGERDIARALAAAGRAWTPSAPDAPLRDLAARLGPV